MWSATCITKTNIHEGKVNMAMSTEPLLEVKNLKKYFKTPKGMLHAVDDVTFTHRQRARRWAWWASPAAANPPQAVRSCGCWSPPAAKFCLKGQDVNKLTKEEMRKKRTDMQIIFQDPFSSLNPRKTHQPDHRGSR